MKKEIQKKRKRRVKTDEMDNRRIQIYASALELFLEKGYDATSLAMIAKRSRMSKANLYYYYPSKEGLLYGIHLEDLKNRFIPIIEEAEQISDPQDRIVFFLKKFALMTTSSPASRVLVHEIRSLSKSHQNEIKLIWRKAYELIRGAIEELQRSGKARKFKVSFLTFLGVSMAFWVIYWWDYSRQGNAEELAETLVQVYLKGLLSTATRACKGK